MHKLILIQISSFLISVNVLLINVYISLMRDFQILSSAINRKSIIRVSVNRQASTKNVL